MKARDKVVYIGGGKNPLANYPPIGKTITINCSCKCMVVCDSFEIVEYPICKDGHRQSISKDLLRPLELEYSWAEKIMKQVTPKEEIV